VARKGLVEDEDVRAARLLDAQAKAAELFAAIEPRGIIAPGVREVEASDAIRDLAADMFGVDRHWHKRIVRAGPNTLKPGRRFFHEHEDVTGEQLYAYMTGLAEADGWTFGGTIAGHLVGQFPHEKIAGEKVGSYIAPGSDRPMRRTDRNGQIAHWILEVHLVDTGRQIGGFFEELLDLGPGPV
jgi:hypothetical protein